jgi:hypothetical protein
MQKAPAFIFLFIILSNIVSAVNPDEGMWLPIYLKQMNEGKMKSLGMKFSADDIYSVNHTSLKDAVVMINNGMCTGEIVSDQGLMLTNHHCGYEYITAHSTVEQNYLRDGFWAKTNKEELANPGMTVSILIYMKDVTDDVKSAVANITDYQQRQTAIQAEETKIANAAAEGTRYKTEVKEFFEGNQFFLLAYDVFKDVRLVGAPPSSIGKFGGETDNWEYPRHTGDFSVFRIYTAPDGSPAEYNAGNIPYKPKKFLQVSLKGYKKGDFSMVMGFPGSTQRYLTSYEIALARDNVNPVIVDAFDVQIKAMQKEMDKDSVVKLALANDFAEFNNTYKYYLGQEEELKQSDLFAQRQAFEKTLSNADVAGNPDKASLYESTLSSIENQTIKIKNLQPILGFYLYGIFQSKLLDYYLNFYSLAKGGSKESPQIPKDKMDTLVKMLRAATQGYVDKPTLNVDKSTLAALLYRMYVKVPASQRPEILNTIYASARKKTADTLAIFQDYVNNLYDQSALLNKDRYSKFYNHFSISKLNSDPFMVFTGKLIEYYVTNLSGYQSVNDDLNAAQSRYINLLMDMKNSPITYPDANSTLRITYGSVLPYQPRDGVQYKYYTTTEGIIQKSKLPNPEYHITQRLNDLIEKRQFGRYAENDTLRTDFITNNDITGGNSGSPVLDADGDLIGLAFDGDWESMISDLKYNPSTNRTICVDIRYVLWVMDVYAGAGNLVNEMKLITR